MAILRLSGSVGNGRSKRGIPHNDPADIIKVRDRFVELGYIWVRGVTTGKDKKLIKAIKLLQCIIKGHSKVDTGDGRIDLRGRTHRWMAAQNAPGWVNMTGKSGVGWKSARFDRGNSWTTSWMLEKIILAGLWYRGKILFAGISDAPPMWIRDCSPAEGGRAGGHKSHQTGIDVDKRLPLLPPDTNKFDQLRGRDYTRRFYRAAALLQVESIKKCMDTKNVFFNDPEFIRKRLSTRQANHSEHYHIRIKPPGRIEGAYM